MTYNDEFPELHFAINLFGGVPQAAGSTDLLDFDRVRCPYCPGRYARVGILGLIRPYPHQAPERAVLCAEHGDLRLFERTLGVVLAEKVRS